jgi:hypothetical protein
LVARSATKLQPNMVKSLWGSSNLVNAADS